MKMIKFSYVDEFRCTGPECLETCCQYWSITFGKREYLNYKKMDLSQSLRELVDNSFQRVKNGNDLSFVQIKLNDKNQCPLLGEDGLCMLQKEKGEDALSYTCQIFPRLTYKIKGQAYLRNLTLNCSRAVEILMNHPEGLRLIEEEYDGDDKYLNRGLISAKELDGSCEGYNYYWSILSALFSILQNRRFTISERMLILGYFCLKADEYVKKTPESLPALCDMIVDYDMCKKIADSLKTSQTNESAAVKSVDIIAKMKERIDSVYKQRNFSEGIVAIIRQITTRLKLENVVTFNKDVGGKTLAMRFDADEYNKLLSVYRRLEEDRPYIIENVLVNSVFSWNLNDGIWANFFTLCVFYNCLKISVPALMNEEYTDREIALAISQVSKLVMNTSLIKGGTLIDFLDNHSYDLPHAAFLIS